MNELNSADVKKTVENLCSEINRHSDIYYQSDVPELSDFEFDQLL